MKKRVIEKLGMELSPLGFGVMRLPVGGEDFPESVYELFHQAMEKGINYYDTAYFYMGEKSEILVREALVKRYSRDQFYIADKLPVWECGSKEDMERIFQVQLKRLGIEWIDFYLLHGLNRKSWERSYEKGVLDFLQRKREEGKIRKIGFSFHDTLDVLKEIERAYSWDFIQLQINYYDWDAIGARDCYGYLVEKGIPCMVMEPVGGGRLSKLPKEAEDLLKKVHPDWSIASWAVRYVADLSNVAVILSGMSDERQLKDNVEQFQEKVVFGEEEKKAVRQVVDILNSYQTIPCSGCRYCMEECPKGVDIPQIFRRYNDSCLFENMAGFDVDYFAFVPEGKRGDSCIKCQKCVNRCPQKIDIPGELEKLHRHAVALAVGMKDGELEEFVRQHKVAKKKIICFGAGEKGIRAKQFFQKAGCEVAYFCDNAKEKWGSLVEGTEVIGPKRLKELYDTGEVCVLIASGYRKEIQEQLVGMGIEVF